MRRRIAGLALAGACLAETAQAGSDDLAEADIDALAVVIEDAKGDYTVIDERMDETGTAAALFGVVGMVANSAQNGAQDAKAADQWRAVAGTLDVGGTIEAAILRTLREKGSLSLADGPDGASHVIVVDVDDWGLTRANQETPDMRAFVKVTVKVEDARGKTVWKDHLSKRGRLSTPDRNEFTDEVFAEEVTRLAAKTGRGIALEIIYR